MLLKHNASRLSSGLTLTFRRDVDPEQKWVRVSLSIADGHGNGYACGWISADGNLCLALGRTVLRGLRCALFKLGRVLVLKGMFF